MIIVPISYVIPYIAVGIVTMIASAFFMGHTTPYPDDEFLRILEAMICVIGGIMWPITLMIGCLILIMGAGNHRND